MSLKKALTLKYNKAEERLDITGYEKDSNANEILETANALNKKIDENKNFVKKITEINESQKLDETSIQFLTETLCFLYEIENEL